MRLKRIKLERDLKTGEKIRDAWVCKCGNKPHCGGFHPCDLRGRFTDDPEFGLYRCSDCGLIVTTERVIVSKAKTKLRRA